MAIQAQEIIFEITRRCNMKCQHCLRGATQRKDISKKTITTVLEQIEGGSIRTLFFSGGEPLLKPELIQFAFDEVQRLGIDVDQFGLVTNGLIYSPEIVELIMDMADYALGTDIYEEDEDDKNYFYLGVSADRWHENDRNVNQEKRYDRNTKRFFRLGFAQWHGSSSGLAIAEGRAKSWGATQPYETTIRPYEYDGVIQVEEHLYVNVNGQVVSDCNLSYKSQDKKALCSADGLTEYLKKKIEEEQKDPELV